jgi:hypothetical protein
MQSATIVDFTTYLNRKEAQPTPQDDKTSPCSEELVNAIETLIQQMRHG